MPDLFPALISPVSVLLSARSCSTSALVGVPGPGFAVEVEILRAAYDGVLLSRNGEMGPVQVSLKP